MAKELLVLCRHCGAEVNPADDGCPFCMMAFVDLVPMELLQETMAAYGRDVRGIVRALWNGSIDESQAYDIFHDTVRVQFRRAWTEGSRACGIQPADWTPEEKTELERLTAIEIGFILPFLDFVRTHNKQSGHKFGALLPRAKLWEQRYGKLKAKAQVLSCGNKKLLWLIHSKVPCHDCRRLDGKIKRASQWEKADLYPNSPRLECVQSAGGVSVCRCTFEVTDEPCSRGPLPRIG